MIPTTCPADDDLCLEANTPATLCFSVNGQMVFIVPEGTKCGHCAKTQGIVTHRISSLDQFVDGIYRCDMTGSDGSSLRIFLTTDDLAVNISHAISSQSTMYLDAVH